MGELLPSGQGGTRRRRVRCPVVPDALRSAPGELAVCVTGVGLVERDDIDAIHFDGLATTIATVTEELTGVELATGGATRVGASWWCRPADTTGLVLTPSRSAARIVALLRTQTRRHGDMGVDNGDEHGSLLGIVGPKTTALLTLLGILGDDGDPHQVPPCISVSLAGVAVTWLLESDASALAYVSGADTREVENAIERVGRPLRLCRVGREAFAHYSLMQRHAARLGAHPSL